MTLNPGDKITIHMRHVMEPRTFRATIEKFLGLTPSHVAAFRWFTAWSHGEVFSNDEGTKWIHGWPEPDSDEVRALTAAAALVNDMRMPFIAGDAAGQGRS